MTTRIERARELVEQLRVACRTQNQSLLDSTIEAMDQAGLASCFVNETTGLPYGMAREIAAEIGDEYKSPAPLQLTPADVQEVARSLGLATPELTQAGYSRDEAIAALQTVATIGARQDASGEPDDDDLGVRGWSDDGQPSQLLNRKV